MTTAANTPTGPPTPIPTPSNPQAAAKEEYKKAADWDESHQIPNFLPLHAVRIPCTLIDNIRTGQLKQSCRALVCQDVVFAHRIQLRAYTAMFSGEVASQPVGDTLDIHFNTLIFVDGSELPISGSAYSPEDPRYPGAGSQRGIHGILHTPPLYTQILSFLGNAAQTGMQQYLQDSQNNPNFYGYGSTSQLPNAAQTVQTTTVQNGNTQTTTTAYSAPNSLNPNWRTRAGIAVADSGVSQLNQELQEKMQEYKPYVTVDRGYPLWVDLDQTINIGARRLNGVVRAQLTEDEMQGKTFGLPKQDFYPPGDARYNSAQQVNNPQLSSGQSNAATQQNAMVNPTHPQPHPRF
jgi:hypothetical protein